MFYKTHMVWHMLDRADRWHAGIELISKDASGLRDAVHRTWISIYGPFKFLVIDGERGTTSQEVDNDLKREGSTVKIRAPEQHARMIERRGAILRHALHTTEQQLTNDGVTTEFPPLLSACIFAEKQLSDPTQRIHKVIRLKNSMPTALPFASGKS